MERETKIGGSTTARRSGTESAHWLNGTLVLQQFPDAGRTASLICLSGNPNQETRFAMHATASPPPRVVALERPVGRRYFPPLTKQEPPQVAEQHKAQNCSRKSWQPPVWFLGEAFTTTGLLSQNHNRSPLLNQYFLSTCTSRECL